MHDACRMPHVAYVRQVRGSTRRIRLHRRRAQRCDSRRGLPEGKARGRPHWLHAACSTSYNVRRTHAIHAVTAEGFPRMQCEAKQCHAMPWHGMPCQLSVSNSVPVAVAFDLPYIPRGSLCSCVCCTLHAACRAAILHCSARRCRAPSQSSVSLVRFNPPTRPVPCARPGLPLSFSGALGLSLDTPAHHGGCLVRRVWLETSRRIVETRA